MMHSRAQLADVVIRTRWYIKLRWYILLAIILPGIISSYIGTGVTSALSHDLVIGLLAVASNGIFFGLGQLKRSDAYYRVIVAFLLVLDVALVTYFIYINGGIESRSAIMYTIPIIISAAIFGRIAVIATTTISIVAYNGLILAAYLGVINSQNAVTNLQTNLPYLWNTVIFFSAILIIIGSLADYLTSLLVAKEYQERVSAEALRRAQAVAKLGSWEWDMATNQFNWSDELYRIFGIEANDEPITYDTYLAQIMPADRETARRAIRQALHDRQPFSFDHRVERPHEAPAIVHSEGQAVFDDQGHPIKIYGTARDITAERSLESAKNDFVSLASHQLRTPATAVKMLLSLLNGGYVGKMTAEQQKLIGQAYDANERQLRVANDLLNVAYVEAGRLALHKTEIDVRDPIEQAATEQAALMMQRHQTIRLRLPTVPIKAMADPDRLYLVMENLIGNASKYTPQGGNITVSLTTTPALIRVAVKDTGIGIDKSQLPKLFQKFSRIDNQLSSEVGGSGLGLYLASRIADLHQGKITVRSKLNVGTTFTLTLPRPARRLKSKTTK